VRLSTLSLIAGSSLALLGATVGSGASPGDLAFVNGAVYTVDAVRSWATAVVVTGDRITYVGNDATARAFIGPATRVVDLGHRMLLPGFQDSHAHPADVPNPATSLDLHGLTHREEVFDRVRRYARAHPEKPWIVGDGWDEVAFLPSGQPTREMLDGVVGDRPAYLTDNSGHEAWVNSRALAAAHITSETPDPPNGRIEHDTKGQPTGALQEEAAMALVESLIPAPPPEERVESLRAALTQMSRLGLTAFVDAMATPEIARAYQTLDRRGALEMRADLCLPFNPSEDDDAQVRSFIAQRADLAGRRLRADCVKVFLDGAYGSHTLVLLQPYSDDAAFGQGKLFVSQERLNKVVSRLDSAGFQVHVHAQGDGAARAALDSFAEARSRNGFLDNRHTIAHLCLVDASDIPRFRSLGVVANMTPLWSLGDAWETVFAPRLFGAERSGRIFQTRTLLGSGVVVAWGSDWPVTGVSPLEGLETAVTHRYPGGRDLAGKEDQAWNPEERVSLEQAIVAYTSAGAYLSHDERTRGSLSVGQAADLVVLDRNLFETAPLEIHSVKVDMTVVGGKVVFARAPG
jgi:predicted amidohydrolase YtcJ